MENQVLVIGCTKAGLQAAQDLADVGLYVNLVESSPFIGGDQYTPAPNHLENALLLEILKHPRIKVWTNTDVQEITKNDDQYQVNLIQNPRYIDLSKCTACGDCVEVCPITVPGTDLKAIHFGGQPGCAVIEKSGISPCSNACPAGIHVQGYVALINQGRYKEAYHLIYDALPFPSVCGRVCNHYCEQACNRSQLDDPVNLMALKRFVADWAFAHPDEVWEEGLDPTSSAQKDVIPSGKKVAIIGAGPAGLTAARDLVRIGHAATVFDDNPSAGGMMRVGIPPHRLPYIQLDWEIEQILSEGVDLRLNSWVDDIPGLLKDGFDAVLVATGAHLALKVPIEGADHPDNWLSLEFLKKACLGEKINIKGKKVIVLGGGDVAMDAARVAVRLGPADVKVVCRGMRASFNEIKEAKEEGIEIIREKVFQRIIIKGGKIIGVECLEAEIGEIIDGKRQFTTVEDTEHLIEGNLVIWALGQKPDFSFLPPDDKISIQENRGLKTDSSLMTTMEGVFTAGDVHRGTTFFVVDAVGDGHRAAESIHKYLIKEQREDVDRTRQEITLSQNEMQSRLQARRSAQQARSTISCLRVEDRFNNFSEVDLGLGEKDVISESGRCLVCGPCSECMACVEVCQPGAITHDQYVRSDILNAQVIIAGEDFRIKQDLPGLVYYSSPEPMAGSAAAFEVIKNQELSRVSGSRKLSSPTKNGVKTGLVLCKCGGEISNIVNTKALKAEVLLWPEIDYSAELSYSCTAEGTDDLKKIIKDHKLGKLILAACSCCSLDQICYSCTYQRLRCKENLGVFSSLEPMTDLVFVNIREQCAWPQRRRKKKATDAARNLIRAALASKPITTTVIPERFTQPQNVLVVGRGSSVETCLNSLAELGLDAESVEVLSENVVRFGGKYHTKADQGAIEADCLIVAPESGAELDHISGFLKLNNQNQLISRERLEMDVRELGVALCPPDLDPIISGKAGAARIQAWISRNFNQDHPRSAVVDWRRCRACGTCQDVCGFGIPVIITDDKGSHALINPYLCQDCGICTAHCPSGAIIPGTHTSSEMDLMLEMILD